MRDEDGSPTFEPYVLREQNGVPIAIIGQAFPNTPKANGAQFTPDWAFGIDEVRLQQLVVEVRNKAAQVVCCFRTTAWTLI